jgi:nucleotide-binding universal stress UspA family protein
MTYKILVAVSSYIGDKPVFDEAIALASTKHEKASLVLLHVQSSQGDESEKDEDERKLFQLWKYEAKDLGIDVELRYLDPGNPGEIICQWAKEWKADLIIMGRRSHPKLQNFLHLGSASDYVVHHAPCSVIVVHHQPKILVAVDNYAIGEHVFDEAVILAIAQHAQIRLLHVQSTKDTQQKLNLLKLREYESKATGVKTTLCLRTSHSPGEVICNEAKTWGADLIIMGRRGHSGFRGIEPGSVSRYVINHAPCSVTLIHHPVKILVGLNCSEEFSEVDDRVFEKALAFAQCVKGKLLLLEIIRPAIICDTDTLGLPILEEPLDFAKLELEPEGNKERLSSYKKEAEAIGVKAEFTRRSGVPLENEGVSICDAVSDWGIDLVILGRPWRSRSGELSLGSVSNYVVHHATCSVLVVHCLETSIPS